MLERPNHRPKTILDIARCATIKCDHIYPNATKPVAAASVAAIPGEAIPLLGVGILMAGTAYELYETCESMKDLDELYAGLGMEDEVAGASADAMGTSTFARSVNKLYSAPIT